MAAARTLFVGQGLATTSMDAVVAEAGVSKQTLYRYFPSKLDLLAAVLGQEVSNTGIFAAEPPAVGSVAELRAALVNFATAVTTEMLTPDRTAVVRLVISEGIGIPALRDQVRSLLPGRMLGWVAELLTAADAAGLVSVPYPERAARMWVGPVFSYVALDGFLREVPSPPPPRAELEHLAEAFLASVGARP